MVQRTSSLWSVETVTHLANLRKVHDRVAQRLLDVEHQALEDRLATYQSCCVDLERATEALLDEIPPWIV